MLRAGELQSPSHTQDPCLTPGTTTQRALYNLGLTGIPITNVNSNCSTGSTALYHANTLVKSGIAECTLALGFERMARGSLGSNWPDRPPPGRIFNAASEETEEFLTTGKNFGPNAPKMFAHAAQEYFDKYGAKIDHLAQIGAGRWGPDSGRHADTVMRQRRRTTSTL